MKIAYGTYAMPAHQLEDAIAVLARIGYDGVEVAVGPRHAGSLPDAMTTDRRAAIRALLAEHGMGVPATFATGMHVHEPEAAKHAANIELAKELNGLMRDFVPEQEPVLAFGIGGATHEWLKIRDSLAAVGREYGALAEREGFHIAVEAHSGAAVDRTSRALWLIEQIANDHVRLHFDMVHFFLAGESVDEAVPALVPITGHTHVTDARVHDDGSLDLLLLGQGELDTTGYVRAMHEAGWDDFITLEVSGMVWGKPDYDAVAAAEFSYASLDRAFGEAGVPRG